MKFREHRGGLTESMATVVDVDGKTALIALMRDRLKPYNFTFEDADLTVEPYVFDERIGWDTYIVSIKGYGVAGFTDGPASQ